jgi:hypothetical protein
MRPAKCASCRPLRGRKATRSITSPSTPPNTKMIGSVTQIERPARVTSSMPTKAEVLKTAECARLSRSRTPNTKVKPMANRA